MATGLGSGLVDARDLARHLIRDRRVLLGSLRSDYRARRRHSRRGKNARLGLGRNLIEGGVPGLVLLGAEAPPVAGSTAPRAANRFTVSGMTNATKEAFDG